MSLLELLLVLGILATLAAMAVPRYVSSAARYRAEMAARRIAADLEYARAWARSTSSRQGVTFDLALDQYDLAGREHPDRSGSPYRVLLGAAPYRADLTAALFGAGGSTVTFDGYGLPDYGGTVGLRAGDHVRRVTVDAQTGRIAIE